MIVGAFLRSFKTYRGINYIPVSDEDRFCGLVGNNGIGKSSVLESMDCFFNEKDWNYHTQTKKSGLATIKPYIVPVFFIKKSFLEGESEELVKSAETLSSVVLSLKEEDIPTSSRSHAKSFSLHIEEIVKRNNLDDHYLLPIGEGYNGDISLSIFNTRKIVEAIYGENVDENKTSLDSEELKIFHDLLGLLKTKIEYIYIPKEIDPELFTKLETNEIQVLMGETLHQILREIVPTKQILEINKNLKSFIDTLSAELQVYSYRTPTDRQQNLKKNDIYNLIIQAFFNIRKLHKKQGDNWLEISNLSSGEKQKAIIDVAHSLLLKHRENGSNLIIGVDEPESSLHMSACFDQFNSLFDISRDCMQVIFSSHWYGFLPTIEYGSATIISKEDNNHVFDQINLANYREQIKQSTADSHGRLPYDIKLKSLNDFVQSVITSSMGTEPYNWLICEGSSEKIYFKKYFEDLTTDKKLRIIPVGGAKEIKRIYRHIAVSHEDFKNQIKGKIILISDTDAELVNYNVTNSENLICKRIVNVNEKEDTTLINIQSNPMSPATEIEDSLNGKLYFETLKTFIPEFENLSFLNDIKDEEVTEKSSFFALDLKTSQIKEIKEFFDTRNNKYDFAIRYSNAITPDYETPKWIKEIHSWIVPPPPEAVESRTQRKARTAPPPPKPKPARGASNSPTSVRPKKS